jgi:hypothetical protein
VLRPARYDVELHIAARHLTSWSAVPLVGTPGSGIMRVPGEASGVHPERIEHLMRRQGLIGDEVRALFQD